MKVVSLDCEWDTYTKDYRDQNQRYNDMLIAALISKHVAEPLNQGTQSQWTDYKASRIEQPALEKESWANQGLIRYSKEKVDNYAKLQGPVSLYQVTGQCKNDGIKNPGWTTPCEVWRRQHNKGGFPEDNKLWDGGDATVERLRSWFEDQPEKIFP